RMRNVHGKVSDAKPFRVAILGARGIGKVHARIWHDLGAEVCAVLGSSEMTAAIAADDLGKTLHIQPRPYALLADLLDLPLDAVSICTPHHLLFAQFLAAFGGVLLVFGKKPLFWRRGISCIEAAEQLAVLDAHRNRRIFVNTFIASILDQVRERLP